MAHDSLESQWKYLYLFKISIPQGTLKFIYVCKDLLPHRIRHLAEEIFRIFEKIKCFFVFYIKNPYVLGKHPGIGATTTLLK